MDAVATAIPSVLGSAHAPPSPAAVAPVKHSYGTRIRQNSVIKPSARMRQSPDPPAPPRRIKPVPMPKLNTMSLDSTIPQDMPDFPPPHIMLHPEDANSKVLLAIARSFLSVDNRAMTIKDLAEMTMSFGLICQNVSAAGQAITTYIRNHMQRCETQDDHPLLLRHTLSGTSADDDLLPALHSRTGGAHCTVNPESRSTNFRRGTMVWYLSRATGAPCPFTRVGIRLCDYGENGKVGLPSGARERKRERDRQRRTAQCGQKRKRLRGYKGSGSESADEGQKPPKIKLTLRLKPRAISKPSPSDSQSPHPTNVIDLSKGSGSDSDDFRDDSMSVDSSSDEEESKTADVPWSLPPYPQRSMSIPCYTPSVEMFPPFPAASPSYSASSPCQSFRRSPSVPFSIASPPPDSEDEDEDYRVGMMAHRSFSYDMRHTPVADPGWDLEFDSDAEHGENETQWESPGPRSPSAPLVNFGQDVLVKQESRDVEGVQGMLDHWEPLDSNIDGNKVIEVVAKAAAGLVDEASSVTKVKVEELEPWDWDDSYGSSNADWYRSSEDEMEAINIKQEDVEPESAFVSGNESLRSPAEDDYVSYSPLSPLPSFTSQSYISMGLSASAPSISGLRRQSELAWKDVELLGPDSVHPHEFEDGEWQEGQGSTTVRMRAKTQPSLPTFEAKLDFCSNSANYAQSSSQSAVSLEDDQPIQPTSPTFSSSPSGLRDASEPATTLHLPTGLSQIEDKQLLHDAIIVHTCKPCTPAISATQIEGISVYQTTLGSSPLFRRLDTDFVNLTPILSHLDMPSTSPPNSVEVTQGSSAICGTWVPLSFAQTFAQEHPLPDGILEIFLSDTLFERFPTALQEFHYSSAHSRLLNQFGPQFKSTAESKRSSLSTLRAHGEFDEPSEPWERGPEWDVESHLISNDPPFSLALAALRQPAEEDIVPETPLSPTEQEMFYALCGMPDWEKDNVTSSSTFFKDASKGTDEDPEDESARSRARDQPRRRSKRVANANAIASRTRTRSQKRSSHNSLS